MACRQPERLLLYLHNNHFRFNLCQSFQFSLPVRRSIIFLGFEFISFLLVVVVVVVSTMMNAFCRSAEEEEENRSEFVCVCA